LDEPLIVDSLTIYKIRLRGIAFDEDGLKEAFDLLEVHRRMGRKVPGKTERVDFSVDEEGKLVVGEHVNEPIGGLFAEKAENSFLKGVYHLEKLALVGYPIAWGTYDNVSHDSGKTLGFHIEGVLAEHELRGDDFLSLHNARYQELRDNLEAGRGNKARIEQLELEFKKVIQSIIRGFGVRLKYMHKIGMYHLSPHVGQFGYDPEDPDQVYVHDLDHTRGGNEPLTDKQKFGYLVLELLYAMRTVNRLDEFEMYQGFNLVKSFLKAFFIYREDLWPDIENLDIQYDEYKFSNFDKDISMEAGSGTPFYQIDHPFIDLLLKGTPEGLALKRDSSDAAYGELRTALDELKEAVDDSFLFLENILAEIGKKFRQVKGIDRLHLCVPAEVFKRTVDIEDTLKKIGELRNKIPFNLVITGVSEEEEDKMLGFNSPDIRQALGLPDNLKISVIREKDIQDRFKMLPQKRMTKKVKTGIVKDLYLEVLGVAKLPGNEYMAIATDPVQKKSKDTTAKALAKEITENISIQVIVKPDEGYVAYSLSSILDTWFESVKDGEVGIVLPPMISPAQMRKVLDEAVRNLWRVLASV